MIKIFKKLIIAPVALSFALFAVTPEFAQAEETISADSATNKDVKFSLLYNGTVSGYTSQFGTATLEAFIDGTYSITLEVPTMLTTFKVNDGIPAFVEQKNGFNVYQFVVSDLTNIPVYIEYDLGYYIGKHSMLLVIEEPQN